MLEYQGLLDMQGIKVIDKDYKKGLWVVNCKGTVKGLYFMEINFGLCFVKDFNCIIKSVLFLIKKLDCCYFTKIVEGVSFSLSKIFEVIFAVIVHCYKMY